MTNGSIAGSGGGRVFETVTQADLRLGGIWPEPGDRLVGVEILGPARGGVVERQRTSWPVRHLCCGREGVLSFNAIRTRAANGAYLCSACALRELASTKNPGGGLRAIDRAVMRLYDQGTTPAKIADRLGRPVGYVRAIVEKVLERRARAANPGDERPDRAALVSSALDLAMSRPWGRIGRPGFVSGWDRAWEVSHG